MRKKLDIIAILLVFISTACFASASDIREDFRYFKPIPKTEESTDVLRIILDSDTYDATSANYSDIRIFNSKGMEIPFITSFDLINETKTEYSYNTAEIVSLKKLNDNRLDICIEIPGKKQNVVSGLTIKTASRNFEKQVSVEASSDMSDWKPVCHGQVIFDYSEVTPLSNSTVKFNGTPMKYFRITIANFTENRKSPRTEIVNEKRQGGDFSRIEKMTINTEHLKIDEIGFLIKSEKVISTKARTQEIPITGFTVKEEQNKTEITFSTRREPMESVTLETSSMNFSRNCSVSSSEDGKGWQPLSMGAKLTRIDIGGYKESNLSIPLEARFRNYRITIINGDAPPLKFTGAKAYGTVRFLELINSKDASADGLSVYYGGTEIPFPSYDIEEILGKLKNPSFLKLAPGAQQENPAYKPGPRCSSLLNSRTFFTAIVVLMVLILSLTLFKSFKKIESIPSEK
ncbi:MAG TPA: hypothetical protein DET40_02105 [Lentisphaeria bacterium]|nr:MAG: hypothetical protein A2X45_10215 [Lentisphaerae bacterium GWF2_50_93]HCE42325.1 hypothetical protein [Lentisphaeria bacterium]